ncbi:DUF2147 domain-containing protein [Crocinitomix algicola]|uniref:DUF2147 domain-containing protein n=1 Tax=Crocinitomix algicola TaxID=1740263 RepID=UPI0008356C79|nr:DUF2147 domain-containing protein [Crocinitomix algicola]
MKRIMAFIILSVSSIISTYGQSNAIEGIWLTEIKDAKIEIYKKGNSYHGRVVWIKNPNDENGKPVTDKNNPNEALRKRPILKMDILIGFVYEGGEWTGKIYDPKKGETYKGKLWISDGNLMVRGYLGWLYDTKTWTKV